MPRPQPTDCDTENIPFAVQQSGKQDPGVIVDRDQPDGPVYCVYSRRYVEKRARDAGHPKCDADRTPVLFIDGGQTNYYGFDLEPTIDISLSMLVLPS